MIIQRIAGKTVALREAGMHGSQPSTPTSVLIRAESAEEEHAVEVFLENLRTRRSATLNVEQLLEVRSAAPMLIG